MCVCVCVRDFQPRKCKAAAVKGFIGGRNVCSQHGSISLAKYVGQGGVAA